MDQELLVKAGHIIIQELTDIQKAPRAALWVHSTDTDTWKFWIVPARTQTDKREFYRVLSVIISKRRADLGGIDAADAEMILDNHPAIKGLGKAFRVGGQSAITVKDCVFDGYYLPEAIILEMQI
jgi:hypothetical protein